MITLVEAIVSARRELRIRIKTYPRWVARGQMTQADSEHEIEAMKAVVDYLETMRTQLEAGAPGAHRDEP